MTHEDAELATIAATLLAADNEDMTVKDAVLLARDIVAEVERTAPKATEQERA